MGCAAAVLGASARCDAGPRNREGRHHDPSAIKILGTFQQGQDFNQGVPAYGLRLTKTDDLLTPATSRASAPAERRSRTRRATSRAIVTPSAPGDYWFTMLAGGQIKWDMHLKVTQ